MQATHIHHSPRKESPVTGQHAADAHTAVTDDLSARLGNVVTPPRSNSPLTKRAVRLGKSPGGRLLQWLGQPFRAFAQWWMRRPARKQIHEIECLSNRIKVLTEDTVKSNNLDMQVCMAQLTKLSGQVMLSFKLLLGVACQLNDDVVWAEVKARAKKLNEQFSFGESRYDFLAAVRERKNSSSPQCIFQDMSEVMEIIAKG